MKSTYLNELFEVLRIPSVSPKPEHKEDMRRCADAYKTLLLNNGVDKALVYETDFNPLVYAEKIISPSYPTVLVYGHYDVMPVEPVELWNTPPFEPTIKGNRIYCRGANDDKGQGFIQIKAFNELLLEKNLHCNVKFLFEGGEEVGSVGVAAFVERNKELLANDVIIVSDTTWFSPSQPTITTGLRGLAYWEVRVTGPDKDLHSGHYGGAVGNPIIELSKLLASLIDEDGRITVPGFYDQVETISDEEKEAMSLFPYDEAEYLRSLDVNALVGEKGYSTLEKVTVRPSFDVCGIWGGYQGEGAKTVLPSKAGAKISCRLVPNQDPTVISKLLKEHLEKIAPPQIHIEVIPMHGGRAYVCPLDHPAYRAAEKAYLEGFGLRALPVRTGGTIGIISDFERILGSKTILMGFGLEEDVIHSPNESFDITMMENGIKTVKAFYKEYAKKQ